MGMIYCPECNYEVSDKALKCPNCGFQINNPKRSFFGIIVKWSFIFFNMFMLFLVFIGGSGASEVVNNAGNDAEATGAIIGGTLAMGLIFVSWVIGDIILGLFVLFTRPKS